MAKYKKKRARELKHDRFRDTTFSLLERLGDKLEGKGRNILYGFGIVVLAGLAVWFFISRSHRKSQEAMKALGSAIEIAQARVEPSPVAGSTELTFLTDRERAEKAIAAFQAVAAKYGEPHRSVAEYFIATNLLVTDRERGLSDLDRLSKSSDAKVSALAKFALAQAREADGQLDAAAAIYSDLTKSADGFVPADSANLRLATIYDKQGKKKEAADILFAVAEAARKARDADGKPVQQSAAAREAAQLLEKIDPDRFAQLPPEQSPLG